MDGRRLYPRLTSGSLMASYHNPSRPNNTNDTHTVNLIMANPSQKPGPPNVTGSGPVRLRQIALVARDLQKAKELLTSVLGTEVIYKDPEVAQWGLDNILVAVGGELIEVVSPTKEGTAAGRTLSKRGDGGYMVIMQHPDAEKRNKQYIEKNGYAKVIFSHHDDTHVCYQYHPKGIKGAVQQAHRFTNRLLTDRQAASSPSSTQSSSPNPTRSLSRLVSLHGTPADRTRSHISQA